MGEEMIAATAAGVYMAPNSSGLVKETFDAQASTFYLEIY